MNVLSAVVFSCVIVYHPLVGLHTANAGVMRMMHVMVYYTEKALVLHFMKMELGFTMII